MPPCPRCGQVFPNPLAVRRHAVSCTAPVKEPEPEVPAWAEAAWEAQPAQETPEAMAEKNKREMYEKAINMKTDGPPDDMAMMELKQRALSSVTRPSRTSLAEEQIRIVPVQDFRPQQQDKHLDSLSVHQGNSYYQSTRPVEIVKPPSGNPKEVTHRPIKNYQWYDGSTFTKMEPHVRMFVELEGIGEVPNEQIIISHDEDSLEIEITRYHGEDWWLKLELFKPISDFKLRKKPNKLVIDLIKKPGDPDVEARWGTKWNHLTK